MPLVIEGQGWVMTRYPPSPLPTDLPSLSTTSTEMPGRAFMAAPGFVAVIPGSGEIMMAPVSVCHQVSTMGHRLPPTCSRYHIHASGLIGSPTEPSSRRLDKSCCFGQ